MARGRKPFNKNGTSTWEDIFWKNIPTYITMLNVYLSSRGFELIEVGNIIDKNIFKIPKGLNSKEIRQSGVYPVISQSKEFIIGFSDNADLLVKDNLPLIVFGDHSKTLKYVENPFVIGADGIKILKPKREYNEKFFYYFLHGVITDTKDYGRHYSLLRKGAIANVKDIEVQKAIVDFLDNLKNNSISYNVTYFNEDIESKIVGLQISHFKQLDVSSELIYQLSLIKQLRQSFLHEAVHGKLVKTNHVAEQETGLQLLEKIKAEKTKLIKSKKLKAGLASSQSLSLISDYIIPKNWCWCKADEILFITKLAGFEYSKYIKLSSQGDVPVIRAQNVRPLKIEKTNLLFIDLETSLLLNRCALTKRCLLVTFIGAGIGDVSTFDESERWHLAPNVAKMEPFEGCENLLSIKFLNYYLMSDIGQKEIFKHVKATAQPSLSMGTLRDIDLPLPSLKEQQQIVTKLEELMKFCDSLEQHIKESQAYNDMLLKQVLREALEPKEEAVLDINSLFEDKNYNLHVAMIQTLIESQLGINHGEVANQKTIFHINTFTNEKIPYQFVNHNFGTFSQQLRDDFNRNPYLTKTTKNNKEVFIVKPSKQKEVLDSIYKPEHKNFVNAVKEILDIYELPFINKETDKIELLNTVSKLIIDLKSVDLDVIYQGMKDWKIIQQGFSCKADKFSKAETERMIQMIQNKGLESKLLNKE